MALSHVGTFSLNTSTGNQSVTGVGFQPKAVIFFVNQLTADGVTEDANISIGFGASSTERAALGTTDEDGQTTTDNSRTLVADAVIAMLDPGIGDYLALADLVSLDSDGFTINVQSPAPAAAYRVGYLALGNTEVTNATVGTFEPSGSSGSQSITGLGFQPDVVFFLGAGDQLADFPQDELVLNFGVAVSSTEEMYLSCAGDAHLSASYTSRALRTNACLGEAYYNDKTWYCLADFTSMDTDGFTINWSEGGNSSDIFAYLAIKGGDYAIGSVTSQTSTGTWAETGTGFQPEAGLFFSIGNAATDNIIDGAKYSIGLASGTNRVVFGGTSEDNQNPTDADQSQDDALLYKNYDYAQAVEGSADIDSWDSNGFTLNQIDADPSGYEIAYLAIGGAAEAGGLSVPLVMHHRRMQRIS